MFDLVDLVDDRDIGMRERRACPRLREQPARRLLGVARRANDFQRDRATETLVLGAVHVTHRAGTKVSDQAIARQCLADHRHIMGRDHSVSALYFTNAVQFSRVVNRCTGVAATTATNLWPSAETANPRGILCRFGILKSVRGRLHSNPAALVCTSTDITVSSARKKSSRPSPRQTGSLPPSV